MLVKKYTCPKCGFTQVPTPHADCGGIMIKVGVDGYAMHAVKK